MKRLYWRCRFPNVRWRGSTMKLPMTFPPLAGLDDEVAVTFPPLAAGQR
jgi:hypothetical protein